MPQWIRVNAVFGASLAQVGPGPNPLQTHLLHVALQDGESVHIEYLDARGQTTHREVRPLQVSHNGQTLILEAFCLLRNDKRRFALERIKRLWRPEN